MITGLLEMWVTLAPTAVRQRIWRQLNREFGPEMQVWRSAREAIEDYDSREAAGQDVSHEIRPRMPGGSDY